MPLKIYPRVMWRVSDDNKQVFNVTKGDMVRIVLDKAKLNEIDRNISGKVIDISEDEIRIKDGERYVIVRRFRIKGIEVINDIEALAYSIYTLLSRYEVLLGAFIYVQNKRISQLNKEKDIVVEYNFKLNEDIQNANKNTISMSFKETAFDEVINKGLAPFMLDAFDDLVKSNGYDYDLSKDSTLCLYPSK